MICGGCNDGFGHYTCQNDNSITDECYSFTSQKTTLVTHMAVERTNAASIVLNDNTLWITGGLGKYGRLASTEHVKMSGSMPGPDLPTALESHAMAAINSTVSMVIGGWDGSGMDGTESTYYHYHIKGEWSNGPSLIQTRHRHAVGIVTDEETNEEFVAVTGGNFFDDSSQTGIYDSQVFIGSSEVLQDGKWIKGIVKNTIKLYFGNF